MPENKLRLAIGTIILLTPLTVFAHGEEVLVTIFLKFVFLLVFALILAYVKIRIEGKLIIGTLYLVAVYLTDKLFEDWPYQQNMSLINLLVTVIPSGVFCLSYFGLRNRFKKKD